MSSLSQLLLRACSLLLSLLLLSQMTNARPMSGQGSQASSLLQNRPNTLDSLPLGQPSRDWGSRQASRLHEQAILEADRRGTSMSEIRRLPSMPTPASQRRFKRQQIGKTESGPVTEEMRAEQTLRRRSFQSSSEGRSNIAEMSKRSVLPSRFTLNSASEAKQLKPASSDLAQRLSSGFSRSGSLSLLATQKDALLDAAEDAAAEAEAEESIQSGAGVDADDNTLLLRRASRGVRRAALL